MIKGLVFDVDGVIINSEHTHFLAWKKVLKEFGINLTGDMYSKYLSGKSIKGGLQHLLSEHKPNKSIHQEMLIEEITKLKISTTTEIFTKNITYFTDTIDFIHRVYRGEITLKGVGKIKKNPAMAIVTGQAAPITDLVVRNHDLQNIFPIIITANKYTHSKPHPECYLKALAEMNLSPKEVIGIEDSIAGIQALNAAGIYSIAVTNTFSSPQLHEASLITEALTELIT